MSERRKVLFTDGMSDDFLLIITDAPQGAIESYCSYHNRMIEDGGHFELFATLKASYYVKELLDSEVDEREDAELIGWVESYDFGKYRLPNIKIEGFRTIKITAGMTQGFELISTNAPDSVILANMKYTSTCEENGDAIDNPYIVMESMGYICNCIGCQDDFDSEELETAIIDAEFDYYNF